MVGIDEVGRGAWAGPLLVCAVRLKKDIKGLKDSKQLSRRQREQLVKVIKKRADIGFGWISADSIDDFGLSIALKIATAMALTEINYQSEETITIDGNVNFTPDLKARVMPKADNFIPEVSAASIMAKVIRDNYMIELSQKVPQYNFDKHVGYGTELHRQSILRYGYCEYHRLSFKLPLQRRK